MKQQILGLIFFTVLIGFGECRSLVKRQISTDSSLEPSLQEVQPYEDDEDRDKRAVNHPTNPKYALKSALFGFVFNKINSFIDKKTAWLDQLDRINLAKNAAQDIHPPDNSIGGIAGAISNVIGQKLQAAGPLISIVTSKLTNGSLGGSASAATHASSSASANIGLNLGGVFGGSAGGGHGGGGFSAGGGHGGGGFSASLGGGYARR